MIGPLAIAAFGALAVSTGLSFVAAQKARKAEEKRFEIEQRTAEVDRARRVRRAIADARIQRAEIEASAAAQTQGTNTAVSGALGSLQTDTAGNIGAFNTQFAGQTFAAETVSRSNRAVANLQSFASLFGGGSQLLGGLSQQRQTATRNKRLEEITAQGNRPLA